MGLLSQRHGHEGNDADDQSVTAPRYAVVSLADDPAAIVAQGGTSADTFKRLFLDYYEVEGERYHPGEDATLRAALVATDGSEVVTVPVWAWQGNDGAMRFLCQSSDDGRPPAFSAFALSESDLLQQVQGQLDAPPE